MKILRLDHIHIYSEDPAGSVRFYETCFGAQAIGRTRTSHGGAMHFLRLGGLALVLAPYPPHARPGMPSTYADGACQPSIGIAHFGLQVDDLPDAVATVRRRGATILSEPREHAGLRFAYVGAPDGVVIELLQYGGPWASWLGIPEAAQPRHEPGGH
jgi:catechol 2,3-dioxygenase-like lactoylglutathione lyase family enzyme